MLQVATTRCGLAAIGFLLFLALALPARAQAACDYVGTARGDFVNLQLTGNKNLVVICPGAGDDRVVIKSTAVPTEKIKVVVYAGPGNDTVSASVSFTGKLRFSAVRATTSRRAGRGQTG